MRYEAKKQGSDTCRLSPKISLVDGGDSALKSSVNNESSDDP